MSSASWYARRYSRFGVTTQPPWPSSSEPRIVSTASVSVRASKSSPMSDTRLCSAASAVRSLATTKPIVRNRILMSPHQRPGGDVEVVELDHLVKRDASRAEHLPAALLSRASGATDPDTSPRRAGRPRARADEGRPGSSRRAERSPAVAARRGPVRRKSRPTRVIRGSSAILNSPSASLSGRAAQPSGGRRPPPSCGT